MKKITKTTSILIIQAMLLGNCAWAGEISAAVSTTLSPQVTIQLPIFHKLYAHRLSREKKAVAFKLEELIRKAEQYMPFSEDKNADWSEFNSMVSIIKKYKGVDALVINSEKDQQKFHPYGKMQFRSADEEIFLKATVENVAQHVHNGVVLIVREDKGDYVKISVMDNGNGIINEKTGEREAIRDAIQWQVSFGDKKGYSNGRLPENKGRALTTAVGKAADLALIEQPEESAIVIPDKVSSESVHPKLIYDCENNNKSHMIVTGYFYKAQHEFDLKEKWRKDLIEKLKLRLNLGLTLKEMSQVEFAAVLHQLANKMSAITTNMVFIEIDKIKKKYMPDVKEILEAAKKIKSIYFSIRETFKPVRQFKEQEVVKIYKKINLLNEKFKDLRKIKEKGNITGEAEKILDAELFCFDFMKRRIATLVDGIKNEHFNLQELLEKEKARGNFEIAEDTNTEIFGYKDGLDFVLRNLRNNVFAHADSKHMRYLVKIKEDNGFLVITFEDFGPGFSVDRLKNQAVNLKFWNYEEAQYASDEETIKLIFEKKFSQRYKFGRPHGLGLWLCRKIIEKYFKGTITAENRKDAHGARFIIKIPITQKKNKPVIQDNADIDFRGRKELREKIKGLEELLLNSPKDQDLKSKIKALKYLMQLLNKISVGYDLLGYRQLEEEAVTRLKNENSKFVVYSGKMLDESILEEKFGKDTIAISLLMLEEALRDIKNQQTYGRYKLPVGTVMRGILLSKAADLFKKGPQQFYAYMAEAIREFKKKIEIADVLDTQTMKDLRRGLRKYGFTLDQIKEAFLKIRTDKLIDYGFSNYPYEDEMQQRLILRDFENIIEQKQLNNEKKEVVVYAAGLGREPTEAIELVELFDQAVSNKINETRRKEWSLKFIGIDANDEPIKNAQEAFDAINNQEFFNHDLNINISMHVERANVMDINALKKIAKHGKGDYVFHRHVIYFNKHISGNGFNIKDISYDYMPCILESYLSIRNIFSLLCKTDTRYVTDPIDASLLQFRIGESALVLRIPGTELVKLDGLISEEMPLVDELYNIGTGIYRVIDVKQLLKSGLKGFLEVIENQIDFEKSTDVQKQAKSKFETKVQRYKSSALNWESMRKKIMRVGRDYFGRGKPAGHFWPEIEKSFQSPQAISLIAAATVRGKERIIGYITGVPESEDRIYTVGAAVEKKYRQNKVASKLFKKFVLIAREQGFKKLKVHTDEQPIIKAIESAECSFSVKVKDSLGSCLFFNIPDEQKITGPLGIISDDAEMLIGQAI